MFLHFLVYQTLGDALNVMNQNEQALSAEYTNLYNKAESNRKQLISSWNRFGINTLSDNAKYVEGAGTASIKGAIDSMPLYSFSQIAIGVGADDVPYATYPTPSAGVYKDGNIDLAGVSDKIQEKNGKIAELKAEIEELKKGGKYTLTVETLTAPTTDTTNIDMAKACRTLDASAVKSYIDQLNGEISRLSQVEAALRAQIQDLMNQLEAWKHQSSVKSTVSTCTQGKTLSGSVTINKDETYYCYVMTSSVPSVNNILTFKVGDKKVGEYVQNSTDPNNQNNNCNASNFIKKSDCSNAAKSQGVAISVESSGAGIAKLKVVASKDITLNYSFHTAMGSGLVTFG